MTEREKQILNLIKKNPTISQDEIASKLSITRSSASVHISNIMKKGYILGKGYVLNEDSYVLGIGGTNVDIQGFSNSKIKPHDSNPGTVHVSFGGVCKNIIENISNLDINTKLITIFGDDIYSDKIKDHLTSKNIDFINSLFMQNTNSSTYLSIIDDNGEMNVAISAMDIFKHLTSEFLETKKNIIDRAKIVVTDTNLEIDTLKYIANSKFKTKLVLDTVSTSKAEKVKDIIGSFNTVKPNKIEAEILSGIKIKNEDDLNKVGAFFIDKGVENIFISLGNKGLFYMNRNERGIITSKKKIDVVNVTGAGDSLVAGITYGLFHGYNIKESAKLATAASIITILDKDTVTNNINIDNLNKIIKEMKL